MLFLRCLYDRAPILSVHFLLGVLIFEAPPEITLVIVHLSVWVSVGLSRRLIASEVENEEGIDRTRWLLHVHIEFLVASNTSEQHEPLHYSVQFRAFIVVCTVPLMCVGLLRRCIIDRT